MAAPQLAVQVGSVATGAVAAQLKAHWWAPLYEVPLQLIFLTVMPALRLVKSAAVRLIQCRCMVESVSVWYDLAAPAMMSATGISMV